ncbi:hypothetical protein EW35_1542 [Staphylococcus aureus]|nr:hypothetical protein EW35_1542 [Staphylococcus aureus]CAA4068721.1 Uncharacterised protein [Staphylococcus aureus]
MSIGAPLFIKETNYFLFFLAFFFFFLAATFLEVFFDADFCLWIGYLFDFSF